MLTVDQLLDTILLPSCIFPDTSGILTTKDYSISKFWFVGVGLRETISKTTDVLDDLGSLTSPYVNERSSHGLRQVSD